MDEALRTDTLAIAGTLDIAGEFGAWDGEFLGIYPVFQPTSDFGAALATHQAERAGIDRWRVDLGPELNTIGLVGAKAKALMQCLKAGGIPFYPREKADTDALHLSLGCECQCDLKVERVRGAFKVTAEPFELAYLDGTKPPFSADARKPRPIEVFVQDDEDAAKAVQEAQESRKEHHKIEFETRDDMTDGKPDSWYRKVDGSSKLYLTVIAPVRGKFEAESYVRLYWPDAVVTNVYPQKDREGAEQAVGHMQRYTRAASRPFQRRP